MFRSRISTAIVGIVFASFGGAAAAADSCSLRIDASAKYQVIDNFGASDCWSIQFVGGWSDPNRNKVADLLFSVEDGIGLSCWRFNVGGGKSEDDIHDPWRSVETFEVSEGVYDWSRQENEQWFLSAAKARGVNQFVAFVNSPPRRMTGNGLTRCTKGRNSTNLRPGYEGQFARYLTDIVEHFQNNPDEARRVRFNWISPVNEPQWDWDGQSQEGNRASNDDLRAIIIVLGAELETRGIDSRILGVESGFMGDMCGKNPVAQLKYGKAYGNYLKAFCSDPQMSRYLGNVIGWHSYLCDVVPDPFLAQRKRLARELAKYPGWRFWQTEYCVMQGPEGAGGGGRDLGMNTALDVARVIHHDLVVTNVSAWQWWLAVSRWDYKDGLIYTDYRRPGDAETIHPSKLLWALGNFSRFIRPGATRVGLEGADNLYGLLGSAHLGPSGEKLVVVLINMADTETAVSFDLRGFPEGKTVTAFVPHVTSEKEDLRASPPVSASERYLVPARAVVTLAGEIVPN